MAGLAVFALAVGVGSLVATGFETSALLIVAGASAMAAFATLGTRRLATALAYGAAFFAPMISLRLGTTFTVGDACLLAAGVLVVLDRVPRHQGGRLVTAPLLAVLGLVLVGGLVSSVTAPDGDGIMTIARFTLAVTAVLVIVPWWQPSRRGVRGMVWLYALGALSSAATSWTLGFLQPGGRVYGLSGHPNHLGLTCALALAPVLGLGLSANSRRSRFAATGVVAVLLIVILITGSRAAVLCAITAVGALSITTRNRRLLRSEAVTIGIVALLLASGSVRLGEFNTLTRLAGDESSAESDTARRELLADAWQVISANPIIGDGFSQAHASHSVPIQLWQGAGILGALGFGALVWLAVRWLRRPQGLLTRALFAAFLGYLTAGLVSNQLWDRYIWLIPALGLAGSTTIAVGRQLDVRSAHSRDMARPRRAGRLSPLSVGLHPGISDL